MIEIRATLVVASSTKAAETLEVIRWCSRQVRFTGGAVWFTDAVNSTTDALVVPTRINSLKEYSRFMLHHLPLYNHLFCESHILVVQPDSRIINPGAWHDFMLQYDYIGAPWPDGTVGNGGFSLRSLKLLDCLHRLSWEISRVPRQNSAEDEVICRELKPRLEYLGCRFPNTEAGKRFSTEHYPDRPYSYEGSFGVHGTRAVRTAMEVARRDGLVAE